MKRNSILSALLAVGITALLAGCWGSEKSTSVEVTGGGSVIASATAVGIDKCHNCHANTAVGAARIFDAWAGSRHANLDNTVNPVDNLVHGTEPSTTSGTCTDCHDPDVDSVNLAMYAGPGNSATARSVIGCEGCHGGGSLHFGVGPIGGPALATYAKPATTGQSSQYNTCIGCHEANSPSHS
jgi:cytochrome c5